MTERLRKLYLPFLVLSVGYLVGYTFLNWLIIYNLQLIEPKEELVNIWVPMGLSGLLILFFMRSRIKALKIGEKAKEFLGFIFWLLLTAPVIFGQFYIETKSGKLNEINNPSEIEKIKDSKYYSIKKFTDLKQYGGLWTTRTSANKHGTEIRITCHFTCPVVDKSVSNPSTISEFNTWLAVTFSETFGNRAFDKDGQKELINDFIQESITKYEHHTFKTSYLVKIPNSDEKDAFMLAVKRTKLPYNSSKLKILKAEKGTYESRTKKSHPLMIGFLLGSNLLWLLMVIIIKPNTNAFRKIGSEKERKKELAAYKDFIQLFVPNKEFWAIPIIIDLNILVFLLMLFSGVSIIHPQGNDLIVWGGNLRSLTTDGQWWRLLTSVFVHGGIMHIGYNLLTLFLIGIFLESFVGSKRFMIIYLVCGIVASIVSLYWHENTISVGASGAIFGMFGLVLALMLINFIDRGLLKFVLIFIGINLLIGLSGMIDTAAHLGGLICGFLIGLTYFPIEKYIKETGR